MDKRYTVGQRIMVSTYYRDHSADDEPVMALPGETGVVKENTLAGLVVVFDRTGYHATVDPNDIVVVGE